MKETYKKCSINLRQSELDYLEEIEKRTSLNRTAFLRSLIIAYKDFDSFPTTTN